MTDVIILVIKGLRILQFAILLRVLWSWVDPAPRHPAVKAYINFIDKLASPFKVVIPYGGMALDLGPLLLMLLLEGVQRLLIQLAIVVSGMP